MSARNFTMFGTAKRFGNVTINRYDDIVKGGRFISVLLHGNEVVLVDRLKGLVKVSNCGWVTPTTHKAINNALSQIGANFGVYAKKGVTMIYDESGSQNKPLVNGQWLRFTSVDMTEEQAA